MTRCRINFYESRDLLGPETILFITFYSIKMETLKAPDSPSLSISNKPNKSLATKLSKVLYSSASEDARIKAALTSLSSIPDLDENNLRRNLRGTIEKKQVETNKSFLAAFGKVVDVKQKNNNNQCL